MKEGDWSEAAALLGGGAYEIVDVLRAEGRNRAARLRINGTTVIAKRAMGDDEKPFAHGDDTDGAAFRRFCNEAAGCEVLGRLGYGPNLLASAPEHGLFVMEDLGVGTTLADRLLGDNGLAAVDALDAYVRTLARMHRETRGTLPEWDKARKALGGIGALPLGDPTAWTGNIEALRKLCDRLGVVWEDGLDTELATIGVALDEPGEWLAFTPSDCCPDNHFLRGATVAFFDCEFATFRHALLDLAYVLAPFPTCWCCNRFPDGLSRRLVALYRSELDGPDFYDQLTYCTACWTVATLGWAWYGDPNDEDQTWGIATLRQRNRLRADNFLALGVERLLPALTTTVGRLRDRLPNAEPMPIYPALRR